MGLTIEGRGHTLRHVGNESHRHISRSKFHGRSGDQARDIMQHTPCIIHHISHTIQHTRDVMYPSVIHPNVENAPFHDRGEDDHGGACFVLPMVCICESPHGMFLVRVIKWNHPLSRTAAYIYISLSYMTMYSI